MKIQIVANTWLAGAPAALAQAINKHTEHQAFISCEKDTDADVLHFNNSFFNTYKPAVIQYHSEPRWKDVMLDCPYRKLVNAQYHMFLPEYRNCKPVRQVINFDEPEWDLMPVGQNVIGYSPTSRSKVGQWHDKGYERTVEILHNMHERLGYDFDVIENVSYEECIQRKRRCSILIDECVTGSYHRSALEAVALGKIAICNLSEELQDWFRLRFGSNPFRIADMNSLPAALIRTHYSGCFSSNRFWMIKNWHPRDVAAEYIEIYKEVLG